MSLNEFSQNKKIDVVVYAQCIVYSQRDPTCRCINSQNCMLRNLNQRKCVGTKSGIIIVGDFNVRYGDDSDPHARALRDVLSDASLRQNVTDATHNRGNVLDLVITACSSSLVTGVSVNNLVTDHFAVICDLATTKPRPPRKTITYRRYAAIDNSSFTTDLSECNVIHHHPTSR